MSYRTTANLIFGVILDNLIFNSDTISPDQILGIAEDFTDAEIVYDGDARVDCPSAVLSFKTINRSEDGDPVLIPAGELVINPVRLAFIQEELDAFRIKHNITQELVPAWHLLTYTS